MCHQAYCARLKLICQSNWQLTTIHISLGAFIHSLEDPYCVGWLLLLKKITLKLATLQGVILSNQYFAFALCICVYFSFNSVKILPAFPVEYFFGQF